MELLAHQRYTQAKKDANDKLWYKEQIEALNARGTTQMLGFGDVAEYKRKKVNYDLFNNILDLKDFEYVCKPYGANMGELPALLTNRDIVSGKIKVLLGMEIKRPFAWKVVATNPEATTRKEQKQSEEIRNFVTNSIMLPIKQEIELKYAEQSKGKQLTEQEQADIQEQIAQEMQAATPDEVKKYMLRKHQDPAEILSHQLLEYVIEKQDVRQKFNKGWKHACLAGEEAYWVGIVNGEPVMKVVNSLNLDYGRSPDYDYIEESEWATCDFFMNASDVVTMFGDELTDEQIDDIYDKSPFGSSMSSAGGDFDGMYGASMGNVGIRAKHCEWRSLRKVGFVTKADGTEDFVSEEYKINKEAGDLFIKWEWIPELHEGWLIADDIYVGMRPVPGQHRDPDNLYYCPLSYKGAAYDNLNSQVTSIMDRIKTYQYLYNIILYRIELLMASDKGKLVLMNIGMIPVSAGIDTDKWLYFADATGTGFVSTKEEGYKGDGSVANAAKEIDRSTVSQISQYIELAEYIERRCGESIGVPKQMEGQIGPNDAVTNTRQTIVQSSHILEPYFELHNNVKRNVLQSLVDCSKVAYSENKPKKLTYMLDDMSIRMLEVDQELLDGSTYDLFVSNSSKASDAKQLVESLAHAGVQNQTIDLSAVFKIARTESATEGEEILEVAEQSKAAQVQQGQQAQMAAQSKEAEAQRMHEKELWKHEADMIVLKEEERRKTVVEQGLLTNTSFAEDKDVDRDGTPDMLEVAKHGVDANIKMRKQTLDERKFEEEKSQNKEDNRLREKEIANKPKPSSK